MSSRKSHSLAHLVGYSVITYTHVLGFTITCEQRKSAYDTAHDFIKSIMNLYIPWLHSKDTDSQQVGVTGKWRKIIFPVRQNCFFSLRESGRRKWKFPKTACHLFVLSKTDLFPIFLQHRPHSLHHSEPFHQHIYIFFAFHEKRRIEFSKFQNNIKLNSLLISLCGTGHVPFFWPFRLFSLSTLWNVLWGRTTSTKKFSPFSHLLRALVILLTSGVEWNEAKKHHKSNILELSFLMEKIACNDWWSFECFPVLCIHFFKGFRKPLYKNYKSHNGSIYIVRKSPSQLGQAPRKSRTTACRVTRSPRDKKQILYTILHYSTHNKAWRKV